MISWENTLFNFPEPKQESQRKYAGFWSHCLQLHPHHLSLSVCREVFIKIFFSNLWKFSMKNFGWFYAQNPVRRVNSFTKFVLAALWYCMKMISAKKFPKLVKKRRVWGIWIAKTILYMESYHKNSIGCHIRNGNIVYISFKRELNELPFDSFSNAADRVVREISQLQKWGTFFEPPSILQYFYRPLFLCKQCTTFFYQRRRPCQLLLTSLS